MSDQQAQPPGSICWRDLTVENAEDVRDFYAAVVGWKTEDVDMGGYNDFSMLVPETGECVAGVVHSRGPNADLPPQWLVYIAVDDVDRAAGRCRELGGDIVTGPRDLGGGRFCVIRDPAGAVCALYAPPTPAGG